MECGTKFQDLGVVEKEVTHKTKPHYTGGLSSTSPHFPWDQTFLGGIRQQGCLNGPHAVTLVRLGTNSLQCILDGGVATLLAPSGHVIFDLKHLIKVDKY